MQTPHSCLRFLMSEVPLYTLARRFPAVLRTKGLQDCEGYTWSLAQEYVLAVSCQSRRTGLHVVL